MKKLVFVAVSVFSIAYAESANDLMGQVSFLISDLGKSKTKVSDEECAGAAKPIGYMSVEKSNIKSLMRADELLRKLDYNYMTYMGFSRVSKKNMNGFTVMNYKSIVVYNGYYSMSLKNSPAGTLVCSYYYKSK